MKKLVILFFIIMQAATCFAKDSLSDTAYMVFDSPASVYTLKIPYSINLIDVDPYSINALSTPATEFKKTGYNINAGGARYCIENGWTSNLLYSKVESYYNNVANPYAFDMYQAGEVGFEEVINFTKQVVYTNNSYSTPIECRVNIIPYFDTPTHRIFFIIHGFICDGDNSSAFSMSIQARHRSPNETLSSEERNIVYNNAARTIIEPMLKNMVIVRN